MLIVGDDIYREQTPITEFMRNILFAQNQYQARLSASTVMQGEIHAVNKGQTAGGIAPYGLKVVNKHFEINEHEAEAVKIMFEMTANKRSYKDIITKLTESGYTTRDGKRFSYSTISTMLRNDKYYGTYVYNRNGGKRRKNRVLLEKYNEVRKDNAIPAIINKDLFDKVQKVVAERETCCPKQNSHSEYVLTGLIRCASCGSSMSGSANYGGRNKTKIRTYVCPKHSSRRQKVCITKALNAEYIETVVKRMLVAKFNECLSNGTACGAIDLLITEQEQEMKQANVKADEYTAKADRYLDKAIDVKGVLAKRCEEQATELYQIANKYHGQAASLEDFIDTLNGVKNSFAINSIALTVEDVFCNNAITRELFTTCIKEIIVDDVNDNIEIVFN